MLALVSRLQGVGQLVRKPAQVEMDGIKGNEAGLMLGLFVSGKIRG